MLPTIFAHWVCPPPLSHPKLIQNAPFFSSSGVHLCCLYFTNISTIGCNDTRYHTRESYRLHLYWCANMLNANWVHQQISYLFSSCIWLQTALKISKNIIAPGRINWKRRMLSPHTATIFIRLPVDFRQFQFICKSWRDQHIRLSRLFFYHVQYEISESRSVFSFSSLHYGPFSMRNSSVFSWPSTRWSIEPKCIV